MNDSILKTIKKYEVKGDFNYASVTDDMISEAEDKLGVKLPDQYVDSYVVLILMICYTFPDSCS